MKLGVLFSGGKDSCFVLKEASAKHEVVCLLSIFSENKESYMFHTPNIKLTKLQSQAINIPILTRNTKGKKELELRDLKFLIQEAKEKYNIEGIVTGAVESVYQATRIQKICNQLDLWCFNPIWQKDQLELLRELVNLDFEVLITGVFGYPLDDSWLGKRIDNKIIAELKKLFQKYKLNPAGEGGELETTVLNGPIFHKRLVVKSYKKEYSNYSGVFEIEEVELSDISY